MIFTPRNRAAPLLVLVQLACTNGAGGRVDTREVIPPLETAHQVRPRTMAAAGPAARVACPAQDTDGPAPRELRSGRADAAAPLDDRSIRTTVSPNGKYLTWHADSGVTVQKVLVGGDGVAHVYDYLQKRVDSDSRLSSPLQNRLLPAIRYYLVCYSVRDEVN